MYTHTIDFLLKAPIKAAFTKKAVDSIKHPADFTETTTERRGRDRGKDKWQLLWDSPESPITISKLLHSSTTLQHNSSTGKRPAGNFKCATTIACVTHRLLYSATPPSDLQLFLSSYCPSASALQQRGLGFALRPGNGPVQIKPL